MVCLSLGGQVMNDGIDFNMIQMTRSMIGDVMQKRAFVPSGDPSMGGAPPGGAPPMDPAMMGGAPPGGAPPMDPAMMGGAPPMDPAMMGGAPPMDPAMMGGAPPPPPPAPAIDPAMIQQMVDDAVKKSTGGNGGASAGGGGLKPKIDVNVELMQIKHMLAKLADALNVKIPAQDLVATPEKLMAMASGGDSGSGGGGAGAIPPIGGISGITPAGTPGGEKAGYDLATSARNIRQNLIHPRIKQAEAAGQAISLPMFSMGGRAASIAAVKRKR
jgi:hypothetical protein